MMVAVLVSQVGCASYAMYQHNKASYKDAEVPASKVIGDNKGSTAAAAAVDIATLWGAYEGYKAIQGDNNDSNDKVVQPTEQRNANRNTSGQNTTVIQGNNNTVNVTSSTVPPEPVEEAPVME